jgi:hypothetical protein
MNPRTISDALHRAGYVHLKRLWVTEDQADVILRMAEGNKGAIEAILAEARRDDA